MGKKNPKHLGKNPLKFNQGFQDQDLCREKQASNENVNHFITGGFALIFNANGRKKMLFLLRSLLLWALRRCFRTLSQQPMLSDWCHWKRYSWIYHISHSQWLEVPQVMLCHGHEICVKLRVYSFLWKRPGEVSLLGSGMTWIFWFLRAASLIL